MPALPDVILGEAGQCIYCGEAEGLSDEHIVPAGLDGNLVLALASCVRCAKVTSGFESQYMNSIREFRAGTGMGSRRRKTAPKSGVIISLSDERGPVRVPFSAHPKIIGFPVFKLPGATRMDYPGSGLDVIEIKIMFYGVHPRETARSMGASKIQLTSVIPALAFARLVAKVAYSYAVSQLGRQAFGEVFVLPAILGQCDDIGNWVGCYSAQEAKSQEPNGLHRVNMQIIDGEGPTGESLRFVVVRLQLFWNSPSPGYVVVVGSLRPTAILPKTLLMGSVPWPQETAFSTGTSAEENQGPPKGEDVALRVAQAGSSRAVKDRMALVGALAGHRQKSEATGALRPLLLNA